MDRLANRLREDAERKLKMAAQVTSYAIYGMVALMIIFFIFRIVTIAYINPLNNAAGG
jgi:type IV pilus assembly protein PilC